MSDLYDPVEEMLYFSEMKDFNRLMHIGVGKLDGAPGRGSGRYELGSGGEPYQHESSFQSMVYGLKKKNFSCVNADTGKTLTGESAIAYSLGMTTRELRSRMSLEKERQISRNVAYATKLRDEGKTLSEITELMGYNNVSNVQSLLKRSDASKKEVLGSTIEVLKNEVKDKNFIDVGAGSNFELGVTESKMQAAIDALKSEGYEVYQMGLKQVNNANGQQTPLKVLCPPGTSYKEAYSHLLDVQQITDYESHDGGKTFDKKWVYPESMDISRVGLIYTEPGQMTKDGTVRIRPGVEDLSLGNSNYAQVRILVDGDRYIKGMAVYGDEKEFPKGVDALFALNEDKTNKVKKILAEGGSEKDAVRAVLKPTDKNLKKDPTNPFGSAIKEGIVDPDVDIDKKGGQSYYYDKNGNKKLSLINKRADEGDWGEWANKLPSQFLSKQSESLARKQTKISIEEKKNELNDILSVTNPAVKKRLLDSFADGCDADSVSLKAAALPRQMFQVILPINSLKDTEIYAPNYKTGETVALVRYPHGGTFEIPILTVNNKNAEGNKSIGKVAKDAVGINSKIAAILSGADFDGDTVMVIPCNSDSSNVKIKNKHPLADLEGFDPSLAYGGKPKGTFKVMSESYKQRQMGEVSNLITDMTLKGATEAELARAVKHSMVVIDAVKHELDYQQSEKDNGIAALKRKYQGHINENGNYSEGASTLISAAKSQKPVAKRQGQAYINNPDLEWYDSKTKQMVSGYDPTKPIGSKIYKTADDLTYTNKNGQTIVRTTKSTKMAETSDARTLISDRNTAMENIYANYANTLKALANQARIEILRTEKVSYNSEAASKYKTEVEELDAALNRAKANAPKQRAVQILANSILNERIKANPELATKSMKSERKKVGARALAEARTRLKAARISISLTPKQWAAIQAGAISNSKLESILDYADLDVVREMATPRSRVRLTDVQKQKIKSMESSGRYTLSEIAIAVGKSVSTVQKYLKDERNYDVNAFDEDDTSAED